jgi:hypothetical protein
MKPKFYPILTDCIERGIQFGLNRSYKHDDDPSQEIIAQNVEREIMNQLYEYFVFDSEGQGD